MNNLQTNLKNFIRNHCGSGYTQTGQSYVFDCPLCFGKRKLYVRKADGLFICFKCRDQNKFYGKAEKALHAITHLPQDIIKKEIYGTIDGAPTIDFALEEFFPETEDEFEISMAVFPLDYLTIDNPFAREAATYLKGRGIPLDIASKYRLRYWPKEKRVIFPVYYGEYLCGWQGRVIDSKISPVKIKSSVGLNKRDLLMFNERLKGSKHAVLCEGPIDAIKADKCGGNVASMGKIVGKKQLQFILDSGIKELYLALDPDADIETAKIVDRLSDKLQIRHMLATGQSQKPDLGAMDFDEVLELFKKAPLVNRNKVFIYLK